MNKICLNQVAGSILLLLYEEHSFGTDALKHLWAFFITIVREKLANRGESSRISVNSCPIRAAFGIFLTDS